MQQDPGKEAAEKNFHSRGNFLALEPHLSDAKLRPWPHVKERELRSVWKISILFYA